MEKDDVEVRKTGAREAFIPFSAKRPKRAHVLPSLHAMLKLNRVIHRHHHQACRVKNEVFQVVGCILQSLTLFCAVSIRLDKTPGYHLHYLHTIPIYAIPKTLVGVMVKLRG